MRTIRMIPLALAVAALGACTQPSATPAAGAGRIAGETQTLFGAEVKSWAQLDAAQKVTELGFTLPLAAIEAAPTTGTTVASARLRYPEAVRQQTFVDHVAVDFSAAGHPPPNVYNVPHFDLHFYAAPPAEIEAIDCSKPAGVTAEQVPEGFALIPPPGGMCEPKMGYHAAFLASPELAPQNPQKFTHTLILGFYDGKHTFIEPMVTREHLLGKQPFSYTVPKPRLGLGRTLRYPTRFSASWDEAVRAWTGTLSGFEEVR